MKEFIEIPFGAIDSELMEWEYQIPEGYEAQIKDGKVIVKKKEPELTEFEQELATIIGFAISQSVVDPNEKLFKFVKDWSGGLLELAKKELCSKCPENLEGYMKGYSEEYKKAQEEYNKSVSFHYDKCTELPCYAYGGTCTNPFHDCINCPKKNTPAGITINDCNGESGTQVNHDKEYYGG